MTRPEGSSNVKPTKADIIALLKEKGIDCKNEGVSMKKSVLEEMAKKAGIDLSAKRSNPGKRPGSSIEACLATMARRNDKPTNLEAGSSINISGEGEEFFDEESMPLNQVTRFYSTYFNVFGSMKHSRECIISKAKWFKEVICRKKDARCEDQKIMYKIYRLYLFPDFQCCKCEIGQRAEETEQEFLALLTDQI